MTYRPLHGQLVEVVENSITQLTVKLRVPQIAFLTPSVVTDSLVVSQPIPFLCPQGLWGLFIGEESQPASKQGSVVGCMTGY